ncbi:Allantoicase [Savitreella phatthalungensis]
MVERVDIDHVDKSLTNLISADVGGQICGFSDEYFASASNLLNPKEPVRRAGYYVETGAWFDGWETRRHNPEPTDWVVIKLGLTGSIYGCEIDTAYFNGNEAPAISVEASVLAGDNETWQQASWEEVIPKTACGPSQRHFFVLKHPRTGKAFTHVKLHQHPDGGIARFRLLGRVTPQLPQDTSSLFDAASIGSGARAVACSDQHFGRKENLILPGRGIDMGDGWETARSRSPDHCDWAVIQLGARVEVDTIVIDTAHFRGNFPESIEVLGIDVPTNTADTTDWSNVQGWQSILGRSKTQADKEHSFESSQLVNRGPFSHVRLIIHPDGGVKRIRVFGRCV